MYENKPNGFEVQDIRLGGLVQRMEHCKNRLEKFLCGELVSIPELEEELIEPFGNGGEYEPQDFCIEKWSKIVSVNTV